jgi:hypothetical protein
MSDIWPLKFSMHITHQNVTFEFTNYVCYYFILKAQLIYLVVL